MATLILKMLSRFNDIWPTLKHKTPPPYIVNSKIWWVTTNGLSSVFCYQAVGGKEISLN